MKINKLYLLALIVLFSYSKCSSDNTNTQEFLKCIKNQEYEKANSFFCLKFKIFDPEGTDFYFKKAHELLMKYGIPPERTWEVKYDTNRIVKLKEIIIPIYKNSVVDESNGLEDAYIELYYDYTKRHIGDSIFNFMLHVSYK